MPSISGNLSVAANARSANLIAGDLYEFLPAASTVAIYLTGSAAGLQADVSLGGQTLAQAFVVAPTNRFPLREEDGVVVAGGVPGERLFISALNTTGGALTINWLVDILA